MAMFNGNARVCANPFATVIAILMLFQDREFDFVGEHPVTGYPYIITYDGDVRRAGETEQCMIVRVGYYHPIKSERFLVGEFWLDFTHLFDDEQPRIAVIHHPSATRMAMTTGGN